MIQYFSGDAKVLIMSGTHCDPGTDSAVSGLTEKGQLHHLFYKEDCQLVGVERGPGRSKLPLSSWDGIPTINKPAEKLEPPPPGSFYDDEDLKRMDFRLANMSYYFGHTQKLIEDMNEVKKYFETKFVHLIYMYFRSFNRISSCWPTATPSTATSQCCSEVAGSSPP